MLSWMLPRWTRILALLLFVLVGGLSIASPAAAQLVVGIEANPGVAVPGEQLEVRITVANQGASDVAGVVLNLLVPAELDGFLTSLPSPGATAGCNQIVNNVVCTTGETVTWSLGTLTARQSVTVSLTPVVAAGAIGPIVFNPVLNSGPSASATVTIDAGLGLDLSLVEAADPVAAGGELAYTLHFGNRSTIDTAPNALLRLPLPASTTFVSASDGGVLNAGAVEWTLGTLAPGQSGTRSVRLTTSAALPRGSLLLASAELSDTSPQTAVARALSEIDGLEGLLLGMVVGPDPVAPGEQLGIELTVSNTSAAPMSSVTLVLRWPQEIVSLLVSQGTSNPVGCNQIVNNVACTAGEYSVWNLGTLNAGQSVTVSYAAALAATPDGQIVDFRATAASSGLDNRAELNRAVAVDATSPLDVQVHSLRDPVIAGEELAYAIHFGNRSAVGSAPNARLQFVLPANTTFVSASDGGVLNGGAVEWSLGTLQAGQSGVRSVRLATSGGLGSGALLEAIVALSDTSVPSQVARSGVVSEIDAVEALELAMVVGPDPAAPGEQLGIELTVSNTGATPLSAVSLALRWPHEIASLLVSQGTLGPVGCNQIVNNVACTAGEFAVWNLGTVNAGQSITVSFSAALAATVDGSIVGFEAIAQTTSFDEHAQAARAIAVDATSPLDVQVHALRDPVVAGEELAYAIHFGNRSAASAAPNALLRFALPANTTFVSASDGGVLNGGAVEWSLGTLQAGQSGARSVKLTTAAGLASGTLLDASVALSDTSAPSELARASAVSEIDAVEALELALVIGPDPVAPGEQLGIELTVGNTGLTALSAVSLVLRWPQETASLLGGQGTSGPLGCNQIVNNVACTAGEFTVWNLGTINAGQSITVSYSAALAASVDGTIVGFEAIAQNPATTAQARVVRAIAVDSDRPLELSLAGALDPITAGDDLVSTLSFVNRSRTYSAPNALLRYVLPFGTTFVSASGGGAVNAGAVEWPLGTLPAGQSGTRTVTIRTNGTAARGTLLRAQAALSDAAPSPGLARAEAATEIDGLEALETTLALSVNHTNGAFRVDLTVTNTDVVSHTSVALVLRVPRDAVTFAIGTVTGAVTGGCNQILNNAFCEAGEFLVWNLGTLTAGQSVTVSIPNLYVAVPGADLAELIKLHAIALGAGTDDRSVARAVPEPGRVALLFAGLALLTGLARGRQRTPNARLRGAPMAH